MYMMMGMKDDLFAVIADPTRRHILEFLAIERLSVGELVEELGISQPTVSKHLKSSAHCWASGDRSCWAKAFLFFGTPAP